MIETLWKNHNQNAISYWSSLHILYVTNLWLPQLNFIAQSKRNVWSNRFLLASMPKKLTNDDEDNMSQFFTEFGRPFCILCKCPDKMSLIIQNTFKAHFIFMHELKLFFLCHSILPCIVYKAFKCLECLGNCCTVRTCFIVIYIT